MTKSSNVTMTDIARRAGVSKNTVSLALRHSQEIAEETRQRIEQIAVEMGYQKNPIVARLMSELSKSREATFKSSLALINANPDPRAFRDHPTIPTYVRGCQERASQLGYSLDYFWLHDPKLDGAVLNRIFRTRRIEGALLVGLTRTRRLPERFDRTWERTHAVVTGVRTIDPTLSFACTDHHNLAINAIQQALRLGYQRPAMALDSEIDDVVDGRFSAGIRTAQEHLLHGKPIQSFFFTKNHRGTEQSFRRWFLKHKPDVILTLFNIVQTWLEKLGLHVPDDIGLIQLEWRESSPALAGMNQHNEIVGAAAVEMIVNMIHNHPPGVPDFPLATLIGSTWVPGLSVRMPTPEPVA